MATEDVPTQLKELFDWNQRLFRINPVGGTTTEKTRDYAFYDMHLAEHLQLKHIKVAPDLLKGLLGRVDGALARIREKGIILRAEGVEAFSARCREAFLFTHQMLRNEQDLVNAYRRSTAEFATIAASMLFLHPGAKRWMRLLDWESSKLTPRAIADGYLMLVPEIDATSTTDILKNSSALVNQAILDAVNKLSPKQKDELVLVLKYIKAFAAWEFKFLPKPVVLALLSLGNLPIFPWKRCLHEGGLCGTKNEETDEKTGPDGPEFAADFETIAEMKLYPPSREPAPRESGSHTRAIIAGQMAVDLAVEAEPSSGSTSFRPNIQKGKKLESGETCDPEVIAKQWVQETWSEALAVDCTILVFNSGNYEIIGIRQREKQTLVISDIIEPSTYNQYGKLQVGLYITALQDAIERAKLMYKEENPKSKGPSNDDDGGNGEDDDNTGPGTDDGTSKRRHDDNTGPGPDGENDYPSKRGHGGGSGGRGGRSNRSGRGTRGHGVKGSSKAETSGNQRQYGEDGEGRMNKALQLAGSRNVAAVFLRYGIYDSVAPSCFFRKSRSLYPGANEPTPRPSPGSRPKYKADEYVTLALVSEYENCATGVVHGAVLEVRTSDGQCFMHDVIVKLAFSADQREQLVNEYNVYEQMASRNVQGIPIVLGLFEDAQEGPLALVITHEGTSLHDRKEPILPSEKLAFIQALKNVHAAGVLHGDIRRRNLVVNDAGTVAIIDFDQSTIGASPKAQERELKRLERVLAKLA